MSTSMREALEFYANEWRTNGDGDSETPRLSRSWREPTDAMLQDEGQKARAALSSPAPDRLSEAERASIESARKALSSYRETLSDGQLIAFPDLLEKLIAIID